jgi:signal transduction histidine kinase
MGWFDTVGTEKRKICRLEPQEVAMNQFPASLNYERSALDLKTCSLHGVLTDARGPLFQKESSQSTPTNAAEAIVFWSRIYDLRSVAFHPRDRVVSFPDSTERQQSRDAQTARAIEDAVAAERNRLARELHDAVTQTLFAASLIAEVLPDLWDMDEVEAHKSTDELRQLTRGALAEMRTLLFELRPAAMQQARLSDLLKQLSEAMMGRRSLPICLDVQGEGEIPNDVKVEIYRIAQESLNNIVKYARATQVQIQVQIETSHVHMEIKDNGVGFDSTCVRPTSLGLRIMRERAEAIHAELQVSSQPGRGTAIWLDWHK